MSTGLDRKMPNTTGHNNVAIGYTAGEFLPGNTGFGSSALRASTTGAGICTHYDCIYCGETVQTEKSYCPNCNAPLNNEYGKEVGE